MVMNKQLLEIRQRRNDLLARIELQRSQLAEVGARWQTPLALADLGMAAMRFLRSNPALFAGVVAVLVIRRHGFIGLGMILWKAWRLFHVAKSWAPNSVNRTR